MGWLKTGFTAALAYEGVIQVKETAERHVFWSMSRRFCDWSGKKLLRIGVRRSFLEPPNGDVTLDIDPIVQKIRGGVWGDVRKMPFANRQFGVCFCEHVLEHLHSAEDVDMAVKECVRVSDVAVFLCPSPYSIWSSFFCQTHYQRIWFNPAINTIVAKPNVLRTGLGIDAPAILNQSLVAVDKVPVVLGRGAVTFRQLQARASGHTMFRRNGLLQTRLVPLHG